MVRTFGIIPAMGNKERQNRQSHGKNDQQRGLPSRNALTPTELSNTANSLKRDLIGFGANPLLHLATSDLLTLGAIAAYAGPDGTNEVNAFNINGSVREIADRVMTHYGSNMNEYRDVLLKSGLISSTEDQQAQQFTRMRMITQAQRLQLEFLQRFANASNTLINPNNFLESPMVSAFRNVPNNQRGRIEAQAGRLVAQYFHINGERRNDPFFAKTRLFPAETTDTSISFIIQEPTLIVDVPDRLTHITIPVNTKPETILVGGPGTLTLPAVNDFLKYPKVVFADRSRFVAEALQEVAHLKGRATGVDLERTTVASTDKGIQVAAEQYGKQASVVLLSMMHSAPEDVIFETMRRLGQDLPENATVVIMAPDRVQADETPVDRFIEEAQAAGLEQIAVIVNNRQVDSYTYPFPNVVPGHEDPHRRVSIVAFRQPQKAA